VNRRAFFAKLSLAGAAAAVVPKPSPALAAPGLSQATVEALQTLPWHQVPLPMQQEWVSYSIASLQRQVSELRQVESELRQVEHLGRSVTAAGAPVQKVGAYCARCGDCMYLVGKRDGADLFTCGRCHETWLVDPQPLRARPMRYELPIEWHVVSASPLPRLEDYDSYEAWVKACVDR
jgi:ribosomal protein S27AE